MKKQTPKDKALSLASEIAEKYLTYHYASQYTQDARQSETYRDVAYAYSSSLNTICDRMGITYEQKANILKGLDAQAVANAKKYFEA